MTSRRWRRPLPSAGRVSLRVTSSLAAAAPGAHDEAGAGDAPVVAVEIGVDQAPRRAGERGDRPSVARLDGEGGERGQPPLHRPQVEGVELPLDLDGVVSPGSSPLGIRTSRSRYCGSSSRFPGRPRLPRIGRARDGNLRRQWRDEQ